MFAFKVINLFYIWANATNLRIILAIALLIYVLCRFYRLKQPILKSNIIDAICGHNQQIDKNNHLSNHRCNSVESMEWWPIANRAACLDSVENSRSAIEKVGKNYRTKKKNNNQFTYMHKSNQR